MEFAALGREGQHQYEEEEEEVVGYVAKNPMFSSCSSSSSSPSPSSNYSQYNKGLIPQPNMLWGAQEYDRQQQQQQQRRQRLWLLGALESEEKGGRSNDAEAAQGEQDPSFSQRLDLMDLSSHQTQSSNSDADAGDAGGGNGGTGPSGPIGSGRGGSSSSSRCCIFEREHMFDKVVTPSDVGKLNRLVIPKQHAEKYFPLDSTANEKGLLLSFEDRNGKPWRFRYSYWNSSQSYVMTKGWSRFVKEKMLDAGDIVSFERGVGDLGKDTLYIDWRRRPDAPDPSSSSSSLLPPLPPLGLPLRHALALGPPPPVPVPWSRWYLPTPNPTNPPKHMHLDHHLNYDPTTHDHHRHHHLLQPYHNPTNSNSNYNRSCYSYSGIGGGGADAVADTGSRSFGGYNHNYNYNYNVVNPTGLSPGSSFYLRSSSTPPQHDVRVGVGVVQEDRTPVPMVIESVPVVHGKAAAKRVRLFGVNLDCPTTEDDSDSEGDIFLSSTSTNSTIPSTTTMPYSLSPTLQLPLTSSLPSLQLMAYSTGAPLPTAPAQRPKNANKSLSFNFDI